MSEQPVVITFTMTQEEAIKVMMILDIMKYFATFIAIAGFVCFVLLIRAAYRERKKTLERIKQQRNSDHIRIQGNKLP